MGERSNELLTYLPASLVRAYAEDFGLIVPWCRPLQGTMLMADLSGFTAISERLAKLGDEGAERLTSVINSFFERMIKTASFYGGDTLTFGGDAILLLFQGQEHADRAVASALGMLKQVERAAAVDAGDAKVKIGMSVGAHSDTFLLAATGLAHTQLRALFLGQGTESTALAEAEADRGQVAVSAQTRKLLVSRRRTTRAGEFWRVEQFDAKDVCPLAPEETSLSGEEMAVLSPFLPPYTSEILARGGTGLQLTPEHRRVAVVFVNILGLTELIGHEGPDGMLEQLQRYVAQVIHLSEKHRGFVVSSDIATKGSKLILTFGAPVAHEYAAANAARFALELNAWLRDAELDIEHRIGVNGGHVFAGEVGPVFRRQYTVMGDAVNLAARLMAAAPPGQVYASKDLLDTSGPSFGSYELPPMKVKGKEQPVAVCVLEEERQTDRQTHAWRQQRDHQSRLCGRRRELALLHERWLQAADGNGTTILIEGEAGVGKTRLLDEALREIPRSVGVTRAACFEHLQAAPFAPWVDVLHSVFGMTAPDSKDERTARVQMRLGVDLPDWLEFASLLNPLLDLDLQQTEVVTSLDAQSRRRKLFELVTAVLASAAGERGHVVLIEDLHWMDESSLALVVHAAGQAPATRLLFLLTKRSTEEPPLLRDAELERVVLTELSRFDSLAMVRGALEVEDLPAEVGEAIYAKTKGNPLFLEEVVHSLGDPEVLDRILHASSVKRAAELAALEIPDRVQGLLMARLDRLSAETREVLKAGSVVGRSFDKKLLEGIDDELLRPILLDRALDELAVAALVVPEEREGQASVTFRHALVQDVAYESLPFARRRTLHGEIARYLEAVESPPDHALLVHHFERAKNPEKTRLHAVRASASSVDVYANAEAVDYLDIAHATVTGSTPVSACLRSRFEELTGDSLQMLGRHEDAIESFLLARRRWASDGARRLAQKILLDLSPIEDVDARDSLLCWKMSVSMQRGPAAFKRAIRWLDTAMRVLPADRKALAARILIAKGMCLCRLAHYRESLRLVDQGLTLAAESDDRSTAAYGFTVRSLALSQLGRLGEAITASREAIAGYEEVGDLVGQALGHMNLCLAYQLSDDPRRALEEGELSLAIYARLGDRHGISQQNHNVGAVLVQLGELDEGIRRLEATVAERGSEGCPPLQVGWAYVLLAQTYLLREDVEAATVALREGREILESIKAQSFLLDTDIVEAQVALARGSLDEAERQCRRAAAAARAADAPPVEGEALRVLGQILIAKGEPEAAVEDLRVCVALADETESKFARAQALVVLAEAQAKCHEADPACEDLLSEAIRLFEKMGTRYDLQKALELREQIVAST